VADHPSGRLLSVRGHADLEPDSVLIGRWVSPRALTLTERHNVAVWSQDKDFSVSSLDVLTTGDLLEPLAGRE
jgi:hypothetical protein